LGTVLRNPRIVLTDWEHRQLRNFFRIPPKTDRQLVKWWMVETLGWDGGGRMPSPGSPSDRSFPTTQLWLESLCERPEVLQLAGEVLGKYGRSR
jgi:hypothetical protein